MSNLIKKGFIKIGICEDNKPVGEKKYFNIPTSKCCTPSSSPPPPPPPSSSSSSIN